MRRRSGCLLAVVLLGCSSSSETPVAFDDGSGTTAADLGEARMAYPPAPFGAGTGATIENFRFLGWQAPKDVRYDAERLEPVSLAQFYDPKGEAGIRFLVITSTAVWCSACKQEYVDLAKSVAAYQKKGVRFLGALFEDKDSRPAKPSDLQLWAKQFDVRFPFALDPELKLGSFFDVEATPMEMIIDTRTMKIVRIDEGWITKGNGSLWSNLDALLAP